MGSMSILLKIGVYRNTIGSRGILKVLWEIIKVAGEYYRYYDKTIGRRGIQKVCSIGILLLVVEYYKLYIIM